MKSNTELYGRYKPPPIPQDVIDTRVRMLNHELKTELIFFSYSPQVTRLMSAIQFWETINEK